MGAGVAVGEGEAGGGHFGAGGFCGNVSNEETGVGVLVDGFGGCKEGIRAYGFWGRLRRERGPRHLLLCLLSPLLVVGVR